MMNKEFKEWLEEQKYVWTYSTLVINISKDQGWVLYSTILKILGEKNMKGRIIWNWKEILEVDVGI